MISASDGDAFQVVGGLFLVPWRQAILYVLGLLTCFVFFAFGCAQTQVDDFTLLVQNWHRSFSRNTRVVGVI